jgi:hypothetical protein
MCRIDAGGPGVQASDLYLEDAAEAVSWSRHTGAEQRVLISYNNAGAWSHDAEVLSARLHDAELGCLPAAAGCYCSVSGPLASKR